VSAIFAFQVFGDPQSRQTSGVLRQSRRIFSRTNWHCVLLVAFWGGALCATVQAQTNFTNATPKPIMHSRVFQWSDMQPAAATNIAYKNVFDAPTATLDEYSCHITTLYPGQAPHPPHQHPEEELLIIKEGTLEVMQNGVTNQVGAGGMVFCASEELHGWRNTSTNPVTYYVIKVYPHDLPKAAPAAEQNSNK
jgi:XRE family transcriptional regulator, regulator of sulfur utilization